jgi:hypothetical protein
MMCVLKAPCDVLLQRLKPLRGKERIGLTRGFDAQCFAELRDLRKPVSAALTVGQVFGKPRVNRLAATLGDIAIKEYLVPKVAAEGHHA